MSANHKPVTPLPWILDRAYPENPGVIADTPNGDGVAECYAQGDADYINHAANAYPELVTQLKRFIDLPNDFIVPSVKAKMRDVLRELGESC